MDKGLVVSVIVLAGLMAVVPVAQAGVAPHWGDSTIGSDAVPATTDSGSSDMCDATVETNCWYWCYDSTKNEYRQCECSVYVSLWGCAGDIDAVIGKVTN